MLKICKRIIALVIAFCLVAVSCPFAWAYDDEYVAQHRPTVWEYIIDSTDSAMRLLFNSVVGTFVGTDYCAFTDSKKHEGTEVVSKKVGSDGEYIFFIRCTGCGKTFAYKGSDAQNQYNNAVHDNNLDNGVVATPQGGLYWYPTIDDVSEVRYRIGTASSYSVGSIPDSFVDRTRSITSSYNNRYLSFDIVDSSSSDQSYYSSSPTMLGVCIYLKAPISGHYKSSSVYTKFNMSSYTGYPYSNTDTHTYPESDYLSGDTISVLLSDSNCARGKTYHSSINFPDFSITPSSTASTPTVPSTININNNNYNVIDIDFETRKVRVEPDITINYGDENITIQEGDTIIQTIYYTIEDDPDPGNDPDPGDDPGDGSTSDPSSDPGTVDPGDSSGSGGAGCCEQCQILLRQANQYLLQIQTLVDQINDKLGEDGDNYTQGIYNLLVEINNALDNLPTEPHKDYEEKLNLIANQLANIWGDLETIKTSLSAVETNTAETNEKLDTVHDDLEAVLAELQEQKGILQQILDALKKILSHVVSIDENVEELSTEEEQENFVTSFIGKFGFINDIYRITVQMMRDVTNDAVSAQAVSDGIIPTSILSAGHASEGDTLESVSVNASRSLASGATAPEIVTRFPDAEFLGVNLSNYSAINLSWYAPYKSEVDQILSGFMYLGYLWLLFKRLPSIIRGGAMASSDYDQVQNQYYGKKGD